jgi:hypothetical protein
MTRMPRRIAVAKVGAALLRGPRLLRRSRPRVREDFPGARSAPMLNRYPSPCPSPRCAGRGDPRRGSSEGLFVRRGSTFEGLFVRRGSTFEGLFVRRGSTFEGLFVRRGSSFGGALRSEGLFVRGALRRGSSFEGLFVRRGSTFATGRGGISKGLSSRRAGASAPTPSPREAGRGLG